MKLVIKAATLAGLALVATETLATPGWCVGGPRGPSYAYTTQETALECADAVAALSNDPNCSRLVKARPCDAQPRFFNRVRPEQCICNPRTGYVGVWTGHGFNPGH